MSWDDPYMPTPGLSILDGRHPEFNASPEPPEPVDSMPILRWACSCGRFLRGSAIRYEDHRDDGYYYGIRTDVEYDCSRCGLVKEYEPRLIEVGRLTFPAENTEGSEQQR